MVFRPRRRVDAGAARGDAAARGRVGRFGSVLVPLEVTARSERIVERVATLGFARGARLVLQHVLPRLPWRSERAPIEEDASAALDRAAQRLRRALPPDVVVEPRVTCGSTADEIVAEARAIGAELVVLGRVGARTFTDPLLGSNAERVVRRSLIPILVVQGPVRGGYRRPLFALDADDAAGAAIATAHRLLPPGIRMALVHAYDAPLHGLIYPSVAHDASEEYRGYYRDLAVERLRRTLEQSAGELARIEDWEIHVRYGSPRSVIAEACADLRADLLVLGTHGRSGIRHALLGTVAGDVLRAVRCDVLVVPP